MSSLSRLSKVVFLPLIFMLWLVGYEKYVGEDSFIEYWKNFDRDRGIR